MLVKAHTIIKTMIEFLLMANQFLLLKPGTQKGPGVCYAYRLELDERDELEELRLEPELLERLGALDLELELLERLYEPLLRL